MLDATTTPIPGGVNIRAEFSEDAEGCFITVTSDTPGVNEDVLMALPDTSDPATVNGLDTDKYTVRIYDLENGLPGRRPAVVDEVEVVGGDQGKQEHVVLMLI